MEATIVSEYAQSLGTHSAALQPPLASLRPVDVGAGAEEDFGGLHYGF